MMTMKPPTTADIQKDKDLRELHTLIPPDASLAIGEAEMTHVSHLNIKGLRDTFDADYILYPTGAPAAVSGRSPRASSKRSLSVPGGLLKRKSKTAPPIPAAPTDPTPAPPPPSAQPLRRRRQGSGPSGRARRPRGPACRRRACRVRPRPNRQPRPAP